MHIIDKHSCIECGLCANICPKNAIEKVEIGYAIKKDCIDCGLCAENCPVKAISKKQNN